MGILLEPRLSNPVCQPLRSLTPPPQGFHYNKFTCPYLALFCKMRIYIYIYIYIDT